MPSHNLIVTLWQNDHAHEKLASFERDCKTAIEKVENVSLSDTEGKLLPYRVMQSDDPPRRLSVWVVRMTKLENANSIARQIHDHWLGANQGGKNRVFDLGNGHQSRGNFRQVLHVRSARVYGAAFGVLSGEQRDGEVEFDKLAEIEKDQAQAIVRYLNLKLRGR